MTGCDRPSLEMLVRRASVLGSRVFPLVYCPEMPCGTRYELLRTEPNGSTVVMYAGVLTDPAPSLNLAKVRYRGARLGASAVVLTPHAGVELVSLAP